MFEEFKKFALRGNVVDLAVGVVIGVAFGAIVASFVADIIMPIIGAIFGGLDFSNYYVPLSSKVDAGLPYADAKKQGAVLGYGQFLTTLFNRHHRLRAVPHHPRTEPAHAQGGCQGGRIQST
jgi:large conductance mechanosensitive channel